MVEHDLAKVGVAGSSPVFRSKILKILGEFFVGGTTIFLSSLVEENFSVLVPKLECELECKRFRKHYPLHSHTKLIRLFRPGGGTGRHAGLKILWPVEAVRVRFPPGALCIT